MNSQKESIGKSEPIDLSIVIVAKNEEEHLPECLKSCHFAKEIILVDDESTDKTKEIAKSFGAKVFSRSMNGNWGAQQTYAIQQASSSWILLLDCDERITPELEESIKKAISSGEKKAFSIQRKNCFKHFKASHGPMRPDWNFRLFPNKDVWVKGEVHPEIIFPYPKEKLKGFFLHYPYKTFDQYFAKMNKYAQLSANKYLREERKPRFFMDIVVRPFWAAFKVYFLNKGFLDGKMGFVFAASHYTYTLQKYVRFYTQSKFGDRL